VFAEIRLTKNKSVAPEATSTFGIHPQPSPKNNKEDITEYEGYKEKSNNYCAQEVDNMVFVEVKHEMDTSILPNVILSNVEEMEDGEIREKNKAKKLVMPGRPEGTKYRPCNCPYCKINRRDPSGEQLKGHICRHPGCGKTYNKPTELQIHILKHEGVYPNSCTMCARCFVRADELKKHMTIHIAPSFPCSSPGCGKGYHRLNALRHHQKRKKHGST